MGITLQTPPSTAAGGKPAKPGATIGINGLSGNLGISTNQRVDRQMPWAKFVGGEIQRLPDTPR